MTPAPLGPEGTAPYAARSARNGVWGGDASFTTSRLAVEQCCMAIPEQADPWGLLIVGATAVVGSAACPAWLPCPGMAVLGSAWLPGITMPGVITCTADELVEPITAAVSW